MAGGGRWEWRGGEWGGGGGKVEGGGGGGGGAGGARRRGDEWGVLAGWEKWSVWGVRVVWCGGGGCEVGFGGWYGLGGWEGGGRE
ncbi:hypothetical protein DM086_30115 [Klebsiella pneumoniae]|nr:hypothetical protein DM086_30115 [Klebsiella pneumoniae]